jgi:hypothetical protein
MNGTTYFQVGVKELLTCVAEQLNNYKKNQITSTSIEMVPA